MKVKASSPDEYINKLPEDRKAAISKLRGIILKNMPKGLEEGLSYNMLGYFVPHSIYPNGYHCDTKLPLPFINVASQKNFIALYHLGIYAKKELYDWFVGEYPKHCKYKIDMGKSCIRFKKIDDIPYDLITELLNKMTVKEWIEIYEKSIKK